MTGHASSSSSTVEVSGSESDGRMDDDNQGTSRLPPFSLRAFSEMQDTSSASILPQDLYKNPPSVVEMDNGVQHTSDDSVITRLTMGKMAAFEAGQKATSTTARRSESLHDTT